MPKFLKRPITVVDAIRWTGTNVTAIEAWLLRVAAGLQKAEPGDWIVRDEAGKLLVMAPADFDAAYIPPPSPEDPA